MPIAGLRRGVLGGVVSSFSSRLSEVCPVTGGRKWQEKPGYVHSFLSCQALPEPMGTISPECYAGSQA